jgi:acyl carrier protein
MSGPSAEQVHAFVVARFEEPLRALGHVPGAVPEDLDLLGGGVTDSMGILELIGALEEEFGFEVDFEDLDPEDLTSLGPFCRYVAAKAGRVAA